MDFDAFGSSSNNRFFCYKTRRAGIVECGVRYRHTRHAVPNVRSCLCAEVHIGRTYIFIGLLDYTGGMTDYNTVLEDLAGVVH